jgi:hypothetical protein
MLEPVPAAASDVSFDIITGLTVIQEVDVEIRDRAAVDDRP